MQYDAEHRVPRWVSWHASPEYVSRIGRTGSWERFRTDDDALVAPPVTDDDYLGLQEEFDYARGHLVPYFMSGGDRNADGQLGKRDFFDACTVFEINYMSNIAPQYHRRFNGGGGLWYKLETRERTRILAKGTQFHVIAGTIFGADPQGVGPSEDIGVPDMFYRILVTENGAVPFLFVHRRRLGQVGCGLDAALEDCIVTVAEIEGLTGADFFNTLAEAEERALEQSDGAVLWRDLIARR
jgi:endonuclease G